jgi:drug/metabolite transporter (DMT)-like permease
MIKRAYLFMHIAIVLWGFTAIFGKLISLDEGLLVWYRMLFSALTTGLYLAFTGGVKIPGRTHVLHLSGIGGLIMLHWITFYGAIKASNVSVAISCFSSVALFTAILEPLLSGKLPRTKELLLGIAVSLGVYTIFSGAELHGKGILLSLISAFLASLFTIFNKRISKAHTPGMISFIELSAGFLFLSACLPAWFGLNNSSFSVPGPEDLLYLILLSAFCTTLAFTLSLAALRYIDAFTMNLSVNLEPLYSILLAMWLFSEHELLGPRFYTGSAIILGAVVFHGAITIRESQKKTPKTEAL